MEDRSASPLLKETAQANWDDGHHPSTAACEKGYLHSCFSSEPWRQSQLSNERQGRSQWLSSAGCKEPFPAPLACATVFMSLPYSESWKTSLSVPFLSQAETATRFLLLLVVDIPGAGQFLQINLRPLSSPQFLWLSMTAGVSSEQLGPLRFLGLP